MDYERVLQVFKALSEKRVDYVVVGAVALAIQGLDRNTRDLDLFFAPNRENLERLKQALGAVWDDPEIASLTFEEIAGEYATIRYGPPDEAFVIDLITRLGEAFQYKDIAFEVMEVDGVPVRVATPLTLYKMKRNTLRPQDRVDAGRLKQKFNLRED